MKMKPKAPTKAIKRPTSSRLGWKIILGFESIFGIGLALTLAALTLSFGQPAVTKSKLTSIWMNFQPVRNEIIEELAVTGEVFDVGGEQNDGETGAVISDDIEVALASRRSPRTTVERDVEKVEPRQMNGNLEKLSSLIGGGPIKFAESKEVVYANRVGYSVVIGIEVGTEKKPYKLTISPATIGQGIPGSLIWLCGQRLPPLGWYRLPGPWGTDMPQDLIHSDCRERKAL
jgi:hypothetical protein